MEQGASVQNNIKNDQEKQDLKVNSVLEDILDFKKNFRNIDFNNLLFTGYVRSGDIEVLEGLRIDCRTLTLEELMQCAEVAVKYKSQDAQNKAYMVEYLMYSIITINGKSLVMDFNELRYWRDKYKRDPTLEEQARWVLLNKVPPFLLDLLYIIVQKFRMDFDFVFLQQIDERIKKIVEARQKMDGEKNET